ncbi:MAG: hypothetical protein GY795_34985 [Desulfobacterales bacterium]|nr:hypothetical protein [Desulfobacterales bacterium]
MVKIYHYYVWEQYVVNLKKCGFGCLTTKRFLRFALQKGVPPILQQAMPTEYFFHLKPFFFFLSWAVNPKNKQNMCHESLCLQASARSLAGARSQNVSQGV